MCTPLEHPNSKIGSGHQDQSSINSEFHTKSRVAHSDKSAIQSDWHTKTEMENVHGQVKQSRDVRSKSKIPMSLTFHESDIAEDVMTDDENSLT